MRVNDVRMRIPHKYIHKHKHINIYKYRCHLRAFSNPATMPLRMCVRVSARIHVLYTAYENRDGDNIHKNVRYLYVKYVHGTHIYIYVNRDCCTRQKGERIERNFQVTVVLLTAQIHQGIRLSPLKVLVSLVFRPASNLLLRLLRICNNATYASLHSKRHVRKVIR